MKHIELEIDPKNPFANCQLARQKYANVLTDLVNSYSKGFVLAINNKWGTGKTTFIKMWEQELKNKEYHRVYFNAWENDFENNPLIALMGELKTLTKSSTEPEFKNTLKKAAILSKHIAPVLAKAIVDKYINVDVVKDAIVGVTESLNDVFENEVNEYADKKKNIITFRNSLSEFINKTDDSKPVVFIIDELDRCRPDYSVAILEQIKHFFSVPNIVFVLSIDKMQLGNAVRGVYGSDRIDAEEYLRRFIDIEYSIPEPESSLFYKYLYNYFEFDDFFLSAEREHRELKGDKEKFFKICNVLFTNKAIPLRKQEKIFALSRLSLKTFKKNEYVIPFVYFFLIFIKFVENDFYEELKSKKMSLRRLQEKLLEIIGQNKNEETKRDLIYLEAYLLVFYNNFLNSGHRRKKIYEWNSATGANQLSLNSIIDDELNRDFLHVLESIDQGFNVGGIEIDYFFKKIDLLEKINL